VKASAERHADLCSATAFVKASAERRGEDESNLQSEICNLKFPVNLSPSWP
jgi:hypothetical protein